MLRLISPAVGLCGGYVSGRYLPAVLRVLPVGLLLLDGASLHMAAHGHPEYFMGSWLLYMVCACAGIAGKEADKARTRSWWRRNLDIIALAALWVAAVLLYGWGAYVHRLSGIPTV